MADKSAPKSKRRVKNPESFRERALKASTEADKPAKRGLIRRTASKAVSLVRPLGRAVRKLFSLNIFRFLRRPLRLIGQIIFPVYFRRSWRELRLVKWPNWRESRRLTFAVLIFAVIFGATIALVDYGLDKVFRAILLK